MNVFKVTADFERWLANRLPIIRQDIALKHTHMAEAVFPFFRATFYRWLQHWPEVCGDLHVENFGTWRDEEGHLIWGVNDLDEAWPASYALDLVRLITSAYLAISGEHLSLTRREAAEAIEEGYRDALAAGGKAFVLAERHQWLRLLATSKLRDPVRFWEKMQQCRPLTAKPPREALKLIEESLPPPCREYQLKTAHCRIRQPRASPNSRAFLVARRVHRPRSQSDSNLCMGLVPRPLIGRDLRRKTCGPLHPCERPVRAFSRTLAGSALGAGLFAHRTGFPAPGKR